MRGYPQKQRDFTAKTSKSKNEIKPGVCENLSLVSGNSMSRRNRLSWKWRHMARKSAMFLP
jgi:hypothetical protein